MATLMDCQFATIDNNAFFSNPWGYPGSALGAKQGVGFYTFEGIDGTCYYYTMHRSDELITDDGVANAIFANYIDFLGNSWTTARVFGILAACVGWLTWLYMLSYSCSSQYKPVRYVVVVVLSVVLVVFQGITFAVLGTDWCSLYNCEFSRSAGFSIGALLCFFFGGISFAFTKDYPGADPAQEPVAYTAAIKEVQPTEAVAVDKEQESTKQVDEEAPAEQDAEIEADATAEPVDEVFGDLTNEATGEADAAIKGPGISMPTFDA